MKQGLAFLFVIIFFPLPAQKPVNESLKVLSWNIYMLPGIAAKSSPSLRAAGIAKLLLEKNYDVIVFQEAFSNRSREIIYKSLWQIYPYSAGPANQRVISGKTNSGVWILSRFPILKSESIYFRSRLGTDALSRKGALMAEINFHGSIVQIVGTHLQSAGDTGVRELQCQQIFEELLNPNRREGVPQLICGDMNIDKFSNQLAYRQMLTTLAAEDTNSKEGQYFSFDPMSNDVCADENQTSKLIDYILISNRCQGIKSFQSGIVALKNRWCPLHQDLSDHYALAADLEFAGSGELATQRRTAVDSATTRPARGYNKLISITPECQLWRTGTVTTQAIGGSMMTCVSPSVQLGVAGIINYKNSSANYFRIKLAGIRVDYVLWNSRAVTVSMPWLFGRGSLSPAHLITPNSTLPRAEISYCFGRGNFVNSGIRLNLAINKHMEVFGGASALHFTDNDTGTESKTFILSVTSGIRIGLLRKQNIH